MPEEKSKPAALEPKAADQTVAMQRHAAYYFVL
jgi:hypothetical protein